MFLVFAVFAALQSFSPLAAGHSLVDRREAVRALRPGGTVDPRASLSGAEPPRASIAGDEFWSDRFGLPDPDGTIDAVIPFEGGFAIGGFFHQIGGIVANNIARWDGSGWRPLGAGFDGLVTSLAIYHGELVASGRFRRSGSLTVPAIARWSGGQWIPLGTGLSDGASALAAAGDLLYAAGDFDRAGELPVRNVARWDGASWSALGEGVNAQALGLAALGDSLVAVGTFDSAGTVPASGIAVWNGQQWAPLGRGLAQGTGSLYVQAVGAYEGAVVAAGYFDHAGGNAIRSIAAWKDGSWQPIGNGDEFEAPPSAFVTHGDTLIVGGYGLEAWDGTKWSGYGPPIGGAVASLCDTPAGVVVGGAFAGYAENGVAAAIDVGLETRGGWTPLQSWSETTHGLGAQGFAEIDALANARGGVVAAGYFEYAGSETGRVPVLGIARWDGAAWAPLDSPLFGIPEALLADGDTLDAAGLPFYQGTPVARFDGSTWTPLDTLSLDAHALAKFGGNLYVGGSRLYSTAPATGGVYMWSGDRWQSIGRAAGIDSFPRVSALEPFGGRLVAAGRFRSIGGVTADAIAAWDGTQWTPMDGGLHDADAYALCECAGALYAGGSLPGQGGTVARWDGAQWQALEDRSVRVQPFSLACVGGRLYAGGFVSTRDGGLSGIARWDGSHWSPLGSGVNGLVRALLVHDQALYVGGRFSVAGGHSSYGIARWDLGRELASERTGFRSGTPNPFTRFTEIAYSLPSSGRVRIAVYDVRGRKVATLRDDVEVAGVHVVTWDRRAEPGPRITPGVYFVVVERPGGVDRRRVVLLQ